MTITDLHSFCNKNSGLSKIKTQQRNMKKPFPYQSFWITKRTILELEQAIGQLAIITISFAMQSCQYLKVSQAEQQRIKNFCLKNIQFFRRSEQLKHDHP
jgi:hypothetical protein